MPGAVLDPEDPEEDLPEPQAPGPPLCWERQTWTHSALKCPRLDMPRLGEGLGLLPRGASVCRGPEDMVPERPRRGRGSRGGGQLRPGERRTEAGIPPFIGPLTSLSLISCSRWVLSPPQQTAPSGLHSTGVYRLVSQSTWVCGGSGCAPGGHSGPQGCRPGTSTPTGGFTGWKISREGARDPRPWKGGEEAGWGGVRQS